MIKITGDTLKKLQSIEYEILLEFKKICEENRLDYFLIGGTLLGAVRHGGFIPWDDDIDVGMERSQYETFIDKWKSIYADQQSDYYLQCKEIDKTTPLPFAKLRKNGTCFVERETYGTNHHKGIFIDIFPFDTIPENVGLIFKARYALFKLFMSVSHYKNGYRNFSNKAGKLICAMMSFIPYAAINRFQFKTMTHYNGRGLTLITSYSSGYGFRKHCGDREKVFGKNATIKFENEYFSCPVNTDSYLTHLFGDYMKLPPVEKRGNQHRVLDIDFGDSDG